MEWGRGRDGEGCGRGNDGKREGWEGGWGSEGGGVNGWRTLRRHRTEQTYNLYNAFFCLINYLIIKLFKHN